MHSKLSLKSCKIQLLVILLTGGDPVLLRGKELAEYRLHEGQESCVLQICILGAGT